MRAVLRELDNSQRHSTIVVASMWDMHREYKGFLGLVLFCWWLWIGVVDGPA